MELSTAPEALLSSEEIADEILDGLRENYVEYAPKCLVIKDKGGKLIPFHFNRAQRYVHRLLEEQLETLGKVRALILKGRQQGISTYVGGRFYHKSSLNFGIGVYILTHEQPASDYLFGMVDRSHKNTPLQPETGASNAKELVFSELDSGYAVGTAGAKQTGRSRTTQLFHGSEVAFWNSDKDHFAGIVETIPDMEGTEIILESTANGLGNEFHKKWQDAEKGIGDYIAIFVPWYWQDEYRRPVPDDFRLITDKEEDDPYSEAEYAVLYGLEPSQVVWRRNKITLLGKLLFMQEYPATASEAFQVTGHESYIPALPVMKARKFHVPDEEVLGALIVGVDPSRYGKDMFSISWRQGRKLTKRWKIQKIGTVEAANKLKQIIDTDLPDKMFIDAGNTGAAIWDLLVSFKAPDGRPAYSEIADLVNFGGKPEEPTIIMEDGEPAPGPSNRRAEMWMRSLVWLNFPGGVDIPDEDEIQTDACAPGYKLDMKQNIVLESKQQMHNRGVASPDDWDAFVLTFASDVLVNVDQRDAEKPSLPIPPALAAVPTNWMAN